MIVPPSLRPVLRVWVTGLRKEIEPCGIVFEVNCGYYTINLFRGQIVFISEFTEGG